MKSRDYLLKFFFFTGAILMLFALCANAQDPSLVAKWSFDGNSGRTARDSVKGVDDMIEGQVKYVAGVTGNGLRFDGYTTTVLRMADKAPKLANAFTVGAWGALNTYPWNWVPIVDQEEFKQVGFLFGIDAFGHLGLQVSVDRVWRTVVSSCHLPLKKWVHVVGTFDGSSGLTIYIDGKEVGKLAVRGHLSPAERTDLLIGRIRVPEMPEPVDAIHPRLPVMYSLDGVLDDVEIYDRSLSAEEVASVYAAIKAPGGDVLPWPKLPAGPPGAGPFGAYYASLKYQDTWDGLRRIGPDSDVVVRFDESPIRLVFWQGTNYVPAWVTENNHWFTDEFLETWGSGCPDGGDCEPMSDKQSRYSHVAILESNNARVVVHWRYALNEIEDYKGAWPDSLTGWFDWADEYWTVYPDGVAIRKQVLWTTNLSEPHEWQETIVINGPGQRPEDNINLDALTLENMKGETHIYSWKFGAPECFDEPDSPNIQIVNLKSNWKPFEIVSPGGSSIAPFRWKQTEFSIFHWRNHWPVSQFASSGRSAVAPDRASHTSLSHIVWNAYSSTEQTMTKILMDGLTDRSPAEALKLAKSWLSPAKLELAGGGYRSDGYDPTQRAYVLTREGARRTFPVSVTLRGSEASPIINPAIVVQNWGEAGARLKLNCKLLVEGKDFRIGHIPGLESTDLIIWVEAQSSEPLQVELDQVRR